MSPSPPAPPLSSSPLRASASPGALLDCAAVSPPPSGYRPAPVFLMILPKERDPRFITLRRGGTLTDADHRLLALWAAACAEHVLHFFEAAKPADARPRHAIELARAWVRGEVTMLQARAAGGWANAAA